ncbi:hypothetical protein BJY24_003052 [Nocardia transvalensis]|uniref:Uncharacterized protein n=1 Tax=Nocardia transvalensis TaxID=37333 RepID=A0A7W9PE06_9NOCA|nr:hypothetical protein [Nocardia transvalensis]
MIVQPSFQGVEEFLPLVGFPFALIGFGVASIGRAVAFVCEGLAFVCEGLAFVCEGLAFVCEGLAFRGGSRRVIGRLFPLVGGLLAESDRVLPGPHPSFPSRDPGLQVG